MTAIKLHNNVISIAEYQLAIVEARRIGKAQSEQQQSEVVSVPVSEWHRLFPAS
jgi:hypothetical protein